VRRNIVALALGTVISSSILDAAATPPEKQPALRRWLQNQTYKSTYTPEPTVRESFTAHGSFVRSWYSPILTQDLKNGRRVFRKGAAMVKELYGSDPTTVVGYSVMRKLERKAGRDGKGWLFYEKAPFIGGTFFGRGLPDCTGCHRAGTDYLLTPFRP
jgi:hypothetical protein